MIELLLASTLPLEINKYWHSYARVRKVNGPVIAKFTKNRNFSISGRIIGTMAGPQPASINDKLSALDSVPLFMKSLPQEDVDDPMLSALQSLAHDGTPDGG